MMTQHASGQFMTTAQLAADSICYILPVSTPSYANTPVGGLPGSTNGATLYTSSLVTANLRVECLEVFFDRSPLVSLNQSKACLDYGWTLYACTLDVASGVESCNMTVNTDFIFDTTNRPLWRQTSVDFNAVAPFSLKIRWLPNASMPASCFPMYFTTVMVEKDNGPTSPSNIAAVVVFILLAAAVLIVIACFARYQVRKVLNKFGKKVSTKASKQADVGGNALPPTQTSFYDEADENVGGSGGAVASEDDDIVFRAQYGAHAVKTAGRQQAHLVDGVCVSAHPFIQPWYERNSFVSPDAKKQQRHQSGDPSYNEQYALSKNSGAPLAMQVAHIMGPDPGNASIRRRQPSPQHQDYSDPRDRGVYGNQAPPIYMDPSVNVSMQYGDAALPPPVAAEPRRLQFPSPVHIPREEWRGDGGNASIRIASPPPQQPRVLNPYDED
jgi:hypothetical protein